MKENLAEPTMHVLFEVLNRFDYAVFCLCKNKLFEVQGGVPGWLKTLFPKYNFKDKKIRIEKMFPFLEEFIDEAYLFWGSNKVGKIYSDYWTEKTSDGLDVNLQAHALNVSGENILLIGTQRDWMEHKQDILQKGRELRLAYEEMERMQMKLKELMEIKDQFVTMVAHDIKSPLTSVFSAANLLVEEDNAFRKLTVFQSETLLDISANLNRVFQYLDKLYYWVRSASGELKLDKREKNIIDLVQNAVRIYREKVIQKQLVLKLELSCFEICIDEVLFSQVVNNLLDNAIKYSPVGGEISIAAYQQNDCSVFEIADQGIGMSDTQVKQLFLGLRNPSTLGTSGEKGTGLGLSIVSHILRMHDIKWQIQSKDKEGTRVQLILPD